MMYEWVLRVAAERRVSLNKAANIIEAEAQTEVSIGDVVEAIEAWHAVPRGDRPAGAYWDICLEATR